MAADELAIIGVPVYAGRVAPLAVKRLEAIKGNNSPALIVVTYGNREFEDAMVELREITENCAVRPIAACSFIGEHSFSGNDTPIAANRPDSRDLAVAADFGKKSREMPKAIRNIDKIASLAVPGNIPFKEGMGELHCTPLVVQSACSHCAECISTCPAGAISQDFGIEIDSKLCIFCCYCIKSCPEAALRIEAAPLQAKRQWLYENCAKRKELEFFW